MADNEHASDPGFPSTRMRRLRYNPAIRNLVQQTRLSPVEMILPLFVHSGTDARRAIGSMPGHFQLSLDELPAEIEAAATLGLGGVLLFGLPEKKDALGS